MNILTQKKRINHPAVSANAVVVGGKDEMHLHAFENSFQPNIITIAESGKIISANKAACKLLRYPIKELLSKNRSAIFEHGQRAADEMLHKEVESGNDKQRVNVIPKNKVMIAAEITSATFMDDDGIEKAIITITDLTESNQRQKDIDTKQKTVASRKQAQARLNQKAIDVKKEKIVADDIIIAQLKSDARLEENNEWIKYIAKTSYDVMWDWDINSGEIYVGDSVEEVFGYKIKNNRVQINAFLLCLLSEAREIVQKKLTESLASADKNWKDSYLFKRLDGSIATTISRASIIRDEAGRAVRLIGATQDITRMQEAETTSVAQFSLDDQQKQLSTGKKAVDVIWDWNLLTNEVFIGEEFEELFGYTSQNNNGKFADKTDHVHPQDKKDFEKSLKNITASPALHWEHAYRFICADGTVARVFDRASIIRHADGKAYRMIGVMRHLGCEEDLKNMHTSVPGLSNEKKTNLVKKIKAVIVEQIYHSDEQLKLNLSHYLSERLQYDYKYLSGVFTGSEGTNIQQFMMLTKIERVKELLTADELKLTEIAWKLHYSSVAHLSNQFRKFTGLTPSKYKKQHC